ncbi:FtsX-like permease family protein, partial [Nocardioides sp.]|uniref:FtsX-like permease family protein n=1 Tax=Nocardioides sp. TaxID=35761 RepID=UPI00286E7D27
MIRLSLTLTRAGGLPRMLLLGSCTAGVCALLLLMVSFARLPDSPDEALFNLVADPGTRGGTAFATGLLTLPPLLLLYQAVRLGTAARDRRLAALRLAGATPGDVRRLGALEVGIPAFAGSLAGIAVYWLLRQVLGGTPAGVALQGNGYVSTLGLRLVPTSVAPQWWEALLVVVGTTVAGVIVGGRASRGVVVTPLGVSRRQASAPPRPWGLLLPLAAIPVSITLGTASDAAPLAFIGLTVLGVIALAPWAAYRAGRFAESRTASPAGLLAARRLVADPRPAGRAAAAVGAIALVSGGGGAVAADLVADDVSDPFYYISLALVASALLVALLVAIGTLAVHSVESMLDRKRSVASLAALGMPLDELESAQRWEARLVAMPVAAAGVLLGAATLTVVGVDASPVALLVLLADVVITLVLVWLAISAAVRITRPWALRAASVANL